MSKFSPYDALFFTTFAAFMGETGGNVSWRLFESADKDAEPPETRGIVSPEIIFVMDFRDVLVDDDDDLPPPPPSPSVTSGKGGSDWEVKTDPASKRKFYYNKARRQSVWAGASPSLLADISSENPTADKKKRPQSEKLPTAVVEDWTEEVDPCEFTK